MNVSPMGLSCGDDDFEIRESGVAYFTDESEETSRNVNLQCQTFHTNIEFWPIEHPMEPQDEDRPVRCPMPASSSIKDDRIGDKRNTESLRKRPLIARKEGSRVVMVSDPPVRAVVRKRHHTFSHGDHIRTPPPPSPPLPPPPLPNENVSNISEMYHHELDKFE